MNIMELKNSLTDLRAEIGVEIRRGQTLAADDSATAEAMNAQNETIKRLQAKAALLEQSIASAETEGAARAEAAPAARAEEPKGLRERLASNEYIRAFAYAIRNGITPNRAGRDENCKILLDALTIGGGSPAGSDGGFLVPVDIDNMIHELARDYSPLKDVFANEQVTAQTGWRVMDTAISGGFSTITEGAAITPTAQPKFVKVPYTLVKYGDIIPVSNELANDEAANLFSYISKWAARKMTITENSLFIALLKTLTVTDIAAGNELKGLKTALNALDPMIAANAVIITNQDGFNAMDNLLDGNGRPLMQQDVTTGTPTLLGGHRIHVVSNAQLASASGKAPVFIGSMKEFGCLFERNPMEVISTDIGGNAFRTDSVEVRVIKRMDAEKFDASAAVYRTIPV